MNTVAKALTVAIIGHAGQFRKGTGEPYVVHPIRVAKRVSEELQALGLRRELREIAVAVALLHDVVEDTSFTLENIARYVGPGTADILRQVSDVARKEDGNRATRLAINNAHYAKAGPAAKMIKLVDSIDNARDIAKTDPGFAPKYMKELRDRLESLRGVHPGLEAELEQIIEAYFFVFGEK